MENEKTPLYVAFSTQKGGVGKTTFTVLAASYLYYLKGYNVAVVDCDYPQHSIAGMRKRDAEQVGADEDYKRMAYEQFTRLGTQAFANARFQEALELFNQSLAVGQYNQATKTDGYLILCRAFLSFLCRFFRIARIRKFKLKSYIINIFFISCPTSNISFGFLSLSHVISDICNNP